MLPRFLYNVQEIPQPRAKLGQITSPKTPLKPWLALHPMDRFHLYLTYGQVIHQTDASQRKVGSLI